MLLFFCKNPEKVIKEYHFLPKSQRFAFSMSFNLTVMVWLLSLWLECLNVTRFCFSVLYALCIQQKKNLQWQKSEEKKKKLKILPIYLSYFLGACIPVLYPDVFLYCWIIVSNKYVKLVILINRSWVSQLYKKDGNWSSVYS